MTTANPEVTARRPLGGQAHRRKRESLTISVPEAGSKYFGLSKNASYEAAERGDIPTIRIGKLLRVPIRLMERLLDEAGKTDAA